MHALTWLEWALIAWVAPAVLVAALLVGSIALGSLRQLVTRRGLSSPRVTARAAIVTPDASAGATRP
jgi:hypothetical protein